MSQLANRTRAYPSFLSMKYNSEYLYLPPPLDRILVHRKVSSIHLPQGVSPLRRAVSGEKQNSSGNLKILLRIRRLGKSFQETQSKEVKISGILRVLGEFVPNIQDDIPDFREYCHLHTLLLKQCFLELSPLIAT